MNDPSSPSSRPRSGGATPDIAEPQHRRSSLFGWLWRRDNGDTDLKESLEEALEGHGEGAEVLTPEHREMLQNILSVGELQVDDVMVPRADIIAVEIGASLDEVIETFRKARHSRLPVYRETLDDIIGYLHLKDIVDFWGDGEGFRLEACVHELIAVPPAMPVLELLERMRAARLHMAIVVDEYGGVDGLVTIEDVVEEIIGDIGDEYDEEAPMLTERRDGVYEADARLEVEEFEEALGVDLLPDEIDEEVDTLGGFVYHLLGRIPRRGESIQHDSGLRFEVADADARRVKRLIVRRLASPAPARPD
jgi:CBS domain containing-hemolysin-like protein